ncbi:MAG: hypothetical protein M3Z08_17200 [Chloroflexota bacterium]|nr:hypothetical protein [Chloroflexota bacterium]
MEHFRDWPDYTGAASRQPSPQGERPVLPAHSQEHSITSLERQLSKSITRSAFCMGFLSCMVFVFMGVLFYDTFLTPKGGFHVATPVVDDLLLPFLFISMGILSILRWNSHLLSLRLSATQRQEISSSQGFGLLDLLSPLGIMGICFMGIGGVLIWSRLPVLDAILAIGVLSFFGIALLFSYRSRRAQRRQ